MYNSLAIVPRWRVNELAEIARALIPEPCAGSFIVDFPLRETPVQWLPALATVPNVRLVGLLPSQQIALHADVLIRPTTRYHCVLRTNDRCWSFSGEWTRLHEGLIYQMDPTQPHGAVNWGDTIRLHLMIDVEA